MSTQTVKGVHYRAHSRSTRFADGPRRCGLDYRKKSIFLFDVRVRCTDNDNENYG